jgi:pimeloyl-ACP methyl ester carboxylesterase
MAESAELFPHAKLVIQSGAGHFPWIDDGDRRVIPGLNNRSGP